ncbi:MAG: hypothetical protein P8X60_04660 [Robiginitalea sp.]
MSKVLLYTILQILFFGFFVAPAVMGQTSLLTGQVRNASTHEPLDGVLVELEGESLWVRTEDQGRFSMYLPFGADSVVCLLAHKDFISKRIPLIETASDLELGVIYLEPVLEEVPPEQFITLSEADIFEEELLSGSSEFLQASRDVFLNRVAFDLSPAFFRIRGFDSRYQESTASVGPGSCSTRFWFHAGDHPNRCKPLRDQGRISFYEQYFEPKLQVPVHGDL